MINVLKNKINSLEKVIKKAKKIAVAFSGGIDSTFLLFMSKKVLGNKNVIAITGNSFAMPEKELSFCKERARELEIQHIVVRTSEFLEESYIKNDRMRCYFCKISLFKTIMPYIPKTYSIAVGTNADDVSTANDRPDIIAEREFGVLSPLQEASFCKSDIRRVSEFFGIDIWDKPQTTCLAVRIPFGSTITQDKIKMIAGAEEILAKNGFKEAKVRHYGKLAKIDVPKEHVASLFELGSIGNLVKEIKGIGFRYVAIDPQGY
ncbi:MAG: ATP-dependent sacrificial sulfur transferase LarE [Deltaproteobacteria bacterium]|nr:ATP-dependent sacrificial sulfur transferase LarE [Deltaproteobacteria bacterium]